jgi:hypothetical protein
LIDKKFFCRIAHATNLPTQVQEDAAHIQEAIQAQRELIQVYKKRHVSKWETFLEGLAKALAEEATSNSQDKHIKRLQFVKILHQQEQQRQSARTIRHAVSADNNYQQLNHITFDDEEGKQVVTYDTQTMEQQLIEENRRRFNRAAGSPFLVHPLVTWVGKFGENTGVEKILDADLVSLETSIDHYSLKVLQEMKRPDSFQHKEVETSYESFINTWSKVKEHTASGKSMLHFGHFMAGCTHTQIGRIECAMANFPLRTGYSPTRWQQGIEVMLLKQKNNFHVNKLRAILLFEADFNHSNKRLGRSMMAYAEEKNWLAPEQYGSRKQVSAIDHCLNKRLSFDIIRQFKHSAAVCVNDMKGCYDRIVHSVASVCMQRLGIEINPLRSMFYTIQQLEHCVRTAQGVSQLSFNASDVHPIAIQGIGQGNGAGPQIWAAISTVVLNMLRTQQAGAIFESPISRQSTRLVGYAYVDDTDLIAHLQDGGDEVVQQMQQSLDLWAGGLATTGGQLEPSKSFRYNIQFHWTNGRWRYKEKHEIPLSLTMQNADGTRSILEQVEVWEGRRTLGVRLAPDGNNKAEFHYLREQCNTWADKIRSGMLPKNIRGKPSRRPFWQNYPTRFQQQRSLRKNVMPSSNV